MGNILETVEALAKKMSFSDYKKPKALEAPKGDSRRHQEIRPAGEQKENISV